MTEVNWWQYSVNLLRKTKKSYFKNLVKGVKDRKFFWKTVKPLFIEKGFDSTKTNLSENGFILLHHLWHMENTSL